MMLGGVAILISVIFPQIIAPLARTHGVGDGSTANIVFESIAGGPIMGPRAAYNWHEMFGADEGTTSEYIVEYAPQKGFDGHYTKRSAVYTRFDTLNGTVIQRFCAPLKDLTPRSKYTFRVIDTLTKRIYDAVWDKGIGDDKLPQVELVEARLIPKSAQGTVKHYTFKTAGDYKYFRSVYGLLIIYELFLLGVMK